MTLFQQFESDIQQVKEQIERGLDILSGKVSVESSWIEEELARMKGENGVG